MKGQGKLVALQFVLTLFSIALGAALHGLGKVGFWGMFVIMMLPNFIFLLIRFAKRGPSGQTR